MTSPTLSELDALVAARVMGWKQCDWTFHTQETAGVGKFTIQRGKVLTMIPPCGVTTFSPTTNDADAFAVLARVCESLAVIIVEVGGRWTLAQVTGQRLKVEAPTLRESICRFALRLHE